MTDKLICPECEHENVADAQKCAACGAVLAGNTTLWKPDSAFEDPKRLKAVRPETTFEHGTLYLYMIGAENADPLQFRGKGKIILGRKNPDGTTVPNLFDLSAYHAFSLGVSRQHAVINHDDMGYTIEDLNSSNGTRLNGNRLEPGRVYPLRSGDQLQIGELLIFIYFG